MKKDVPENFAKFTGKHLWFAKFSRARFLQSIFGRLLLHFSWNFTKMVHYQKTSDEYSLFTNTNLKCTVELYRFFLGSIDFQCMSSLVYTVFFQKQPPEYGCSVKKGGLKHFVNFIGNTCVGVSF